MTVGGEQGAVSLRSLGFVAVFIALAALLVPVTAFTFSVRVSGKSMDPTLAEGDRLFIDITGRKAVGRFDLVEAEFEGLEATRVVKRVIALPGDQIAFAKIEGDEPAVLIRIPGGETFQVSNPAWAGQVGSRTAACCTNSGRSESRGSKWATVPADSYWLAGDNWGGSDDSRTYGFVPAATISGRLTFRLSPIDRFGGLDHSGITLDPVSD